MRTLSLGPGPGHGDDGVGMGHGLRTRVLPVYHGHIMLKEYLLFPHNAQCFLVPIIPKIMPAQSAQP